MLNEGRGISEVNKEETDNIFRLFKSIGYRRFIPYKILGNDILLSFVLGNYDSFFSKNKNNMILNFSAPMDFDDIKLKYIITHELNHFIEIFSIEKKRLDIPNYNKIKMALSKFDAKSESLEFFKHLLYKILDNEINAIVAQTYTYLRSFNISDEVLLKSKLSDYEIRKECQDILNFNVNKFIIDVNRDELKELNQLFIREGVDNFFPFILTIDNNFEKYIRNWFKIIISNVKKLIKKQDNMIKEVIEDIDDLNNYSTDYKITEHNIFNYNEYIKKLK